MRITLKVVDGVRAGDEFLFEEHDVFLFGRSPDSRFRIQDDPYVSRHQFLIEANPPTCRLKDLGSKNGTFVNDVKHGGRPKGRDPGSSAPIPNASVELVDGDRIQVGETRIVVSVEDPARCVECGQPIADQDREAAAWTHGAYVCAPCRTKLTGAPLPEGVEGFDEDWDEALDDIVEGALTRERPSPGVGFKHYRIVRKIGQGGMGAVYLGVHRETGREAAIKVIAHQFTASDKAVKRFKSEVAVVETLRHENVVEYYEHGYEDGAFYFAMEYVDGGDLSGFMLSHREGAPVAEALVIMAQVLAGLAYAHELDVVHRDLKPRNVLLARGKSGIRAKISDFGLARGSQLAGFSVITGTHEITGAIPYMSPDQVSNFREFDPAMDVFSLGATFYHVLTNKFVYDFGGSKPPLTVILEDPVVPIRERRADLPPALAELIDRAIDKDPAKRFENAGEMLGALKKCF